jgi:hypothetical protein
MRLTNNETSSRSRSRSRSSSNSSQHPPGTLPLINIPRRHSSYDDGEDGRAPQQDGYSVPSSSIPSSCTASRESSSEAAKAFLKEFSQNHLPTNINDSSVRNESQSFSVHHVFLQHIRSQQHSGGELKELNEGPPPSYSERQEIEDKGDEDDCLSTRSIREIMTSLSSKSIRRNSEAHYPNHYVVSTISDEETTQLVGDDIRSSENSANVSQHQQQQSLAKQLPRERRRSSCSSSSMLSSQSSEEDEVCDILKEEGSSTLPPRRRSRRGRQSAQSSCSSGSMPVVLLLGNSLGSFGASATSSLLEQESSVNTSNMPLLESISFQDHEDLLSLFDESNSSLLWRSGAAGNVQEQEECADSGGSDDLEDAGDEEQSFAAEEEKYKKEVLAEKPSPIDSHTSAQVVEVHSNPTSCSLSWERAGRAEGHDRERRVPKFMVNRDEKKSGTSATSSCDHILGTSSGPASLLSLQMLLLPGKSSNEFSPVFKNAKKSDSRWSSSSDHSSTLWSSSLSGHSSSHTSSSRAASGRGGHSKLDGRWSSSSDHSSSHSSHHQQLLVLPPRSQEEEEE